MTQVRRRHAEQIAASGGEASAHRCDVTDQAEVKATFAELFRRERIHILVNNAGVSHIGTVESTTEADFDRLIRVNVKGFYNCMHAMVGHMREKGGGVILNMASIAGSTGLADRFAYSMTQGRSHRDDVFGGARLSRSQHPLQLHFSGAGAYAVCGRLFEEDVSGPRAEMFEKLAKSQPIGRMAEPAEVASLALFLCSDEASFITGSGLSARRRIFQPAGIGHGSAD